MEQTKERQKQKSSKTNEKKNDIQTKNNQESEVESEAEFDESDNEQGEMTIRPRGFSDDNKLWLKPKHDNSGSSNEDLTSEEENVSI